MSIEGTPYGITRDSLVEERVYGWELFSWSGIFAGILVALAGKLLLDTLGAAVGLSFIHPLAGSTPDASSLGIGAALWWFITDILTLALGGFIAAWTSATYSHGEGVLHGLVTWAVTALLAFIIFSSAIGGLVGGAFQVAGHAMQAAGTGIAAGASTAVEGASQGDVQARFSALLRPANADPASMSPDDSAKEVAMDAKTLIAGGTDAQAAHDRIAAIMAARLNISQDDAKKRLDDTIAKINQEKEQAIQNAKAAADHAASATSKAAFGAFIAMAVGAFAAGLGGLLGVRRRVIGERIVRRPTPILP